MAFHQNHSASGLEGDLEDYINFRRPPRLGPIGPMPPSIKQETLGMPVVNEMAPVYEPSLQEYNSNPHGYAYGSNPQRIYPPEIDQRRLNDRCPPRGPLPEPYSGYEQGYLPEELSSTSRPQLQECLPKQNIYIPPHRRKFSPKVSASPKGKFSPKVSASPKGTFSPKVSVAQPPPKIFSYDEMTTMCQIYYYAYHVIDEKVTVYGPSDLFTPMADDLSIEMAMRAFRVVYYSGFPGMRSLFNRVPIVPPE